MVKLLVKPDNANANTDDRSIKCGIAGDKSCRRRSRALLALLHLGSLLRVEFFENL